MDMFRNAGWQAFVTAGLERDIEVNERLQGIRNLETELDALVGQSRLLPDSTRELLSGNRTGRA